MTCTYCDRKKCDCGGSRKVVGNSKTGEIKVQCVKCRVVLSHWHWDNRGHARPKGGL